MTIPYIFKTYHATYNASGHGDQQMLEAIFAGKIPSSVKYEKVESLEGLEGAVIVMPLGHNNEDIPKLNADIAPLKWVVICLTGNEESVDGYKRIKHPNCKIWLQSPSAEDKADRYLPVGFPCWIPDLDLAIPERTNNWFFSGQNTPRREMAKLAFKDIHSGNMIITQGFSQGLPYPEYIQELYKAKSIPCAGGTVHPDTFRLWESLECGCIPLADAQGGYRHWGDYNSKDAKGRNFWEKILGETPPFPVIYDWGDVDTVMSVIFDTDDHEYLFLKDKVSKWWAAKKLQIAENLAKDIKKLSK